MESILIIDDDVALCHMLKNYFTLHNIRLDMSHDGLEGLNTALLGRFDLILLDVMLPGIDGIEILRRLRPVSEVSVLFLTSKREVNDRINGLEGGADDYVPKPFNPRELVARIRAVLRRRSSPPGRDHADQHDGRLAVHGFHLDLRARTARYLGTPIALTTAEFLLLEMLLASSGLVLSREMLVERTLQRTFHPLDRSLDMLVSRLRRKLEIADNPGAAIRTVRNTGYVFSASSAEDAAVSSKEKINGGRDEAAADV